MKKSLYCTKLHKKGLDIKISNVLLKSLESINKPYMKLSFSVPIDEKDRYVIELNIKKLTFFKGD